MRRYRCRLEPCGSLLIPPDANVRDTAWERTRALRDGRWDVLEQEPLYGPDGAQVRVGAEWSGVNVWLPVFNTVLYSAWRVQRGHGLLHVCICIYVCVGALPCFLALGKTDGARLAAKQPRTAPEICCDLIASDGPPSLSSSHRCRQHRPRQTPAARTSSHSHPSSSACSSHATSPHSRPVSSRL